MRRLNTCLAYLNTVSVGFRALQTNVCIACEQRRGLVHSAQQVVSLRTTDRPARPPSVMETLLTVSQRLWTALMHPASGAHAWYLLLINVFDLARSCATVSMRGLSCTPVMPMPHALRLRSTTWQTLNKPAADTVAPLLHQADLCSLCRSPIIELSGFCDSGLLGASEIR